MLLCSRKNTAADFNNALTWARKINAALQQSNGVEI